MAADAEILLTSFFEKADWKTYLKNSNTALLIIDAQNRLCSENGDMQQLGLWKQAAGIRARKHIATLITECRQTATPVIWIRTIQRPATSDRRQMADSEGLMNSIDNARSDARIEEDWNAAIVDDLQDSRATQDILIDKLGACAFTGTSLDIYLRRLGATTMLLAGFTTELSIESTARTSYDKGFLAITIGDACASYDERVHDASLKRLNRLISPVANTDCVVQLMATGTDSAPHKRTATPTSSDTSVVQRFYSSAALNWKERANMRNTAFIVVDPQNDNLNEHGNLSMTGVWKAARDTHALDKVRLIAAKCRSIGVPVFWIKQNRLPGGKDIFPGTFDARVWAAIEQAVPKAMYGATWDSEIFDGIKDEIASNEFVIEKPGWSSFENTALERYLNSLGVNVLFCCGYMTDFCTEGTIRSAVDRGFVAVLVPDASATSSIEEQKQAILRCEHLNVASVQAERLVEFLDQLHVGSIAGGQ